MMAEEHDGHGIFSTPAVQGITLRSRKRRQDAADRRRRDRFADALAEHNAEAGDPGGDIGMASAAVGLSKFHGVAMLLRIRRRLGWQAK